MTDPASAMAAAAALLLLGVLASKASTRFGIPALLLFLAIGMAAGSEGLGDIAFDDYQLAQDVGVIALAFILFAGGLDTDRTEVGGVLRYGVVLATAGVLVTAVVVGAVASVVLDVSLTTGLLLGAIISSTDAAAVFSVLRSRSVGLRGRLRPLLELESGSNDPMPCSSPSPSWSCSPSLARRWPSSSPCSSPRWPSVRQSATAWPAPRSSPSTGSGSSTRASTPSC